MLRSLRILGSLGVYRFLFNCLDHNTPIVLLNHLQKVNEHSFLYIFVSLNYSNISELQP